MHKESPRARWEQINEASDWSMNFGCICIASILC